MNHQKPRDRNRIEPSRARPSESMGEQRYQELMRSLNDLFQETEHETQTHTAAQRQQAIQEIKALMDRHGLTVEDIGE